MNIENRFCEFYYNENLVLFRDLLSYYNENGNINKYEGKIMCPSCKKAKLSFNHGSNRNKPYLFTMPTSHHLENCEYKYELADNKTHKKLSHLNPDQINSKLATLINMIEKKDLQLENITKDNNPFIINIDTVSAHNNKEKNIIQSPKGVFYQNSLLKT